MRRCTFSSATRARTISSRTCSLPRKSKKSEAEIKKLEHYFGKIHKPKDFKLEDWEKSDHNADSEASVFVRKG